MGGWVDLTGPREQGAGPLMGGPSYSILIEFM